MGCFGGCPSTPSGITHFDPKERTRPKAGAHHRYRKSHEFPHQSQTTLFTSQIIIPSGACFHCHMDSQMFPKTYGWRVEHQVPKVIHFTQSDILLISYQQQNIDRI